VACAAASCRPSVHENPMKATVLERKNMERNRPGSGRVLRSCDVVLGSTSRFVSIWKVDERAVEVSHHRKRKERTMRSDGLVAAGTSDRTQ
jgi:hypothetical protein